MRSGLREILVSTTFGSGSVKGILGEHFLGCVFRVLSSSNPQTTECCSLSVWEVFLGEPLPCKRYNAAFYLRLQDIVSVREVCGQMGKDKHDRSNLVRAKI